MTNVGAFSYRYFDGTNRSFNGTQPFDRRDLFVGATSRDRIISSLDNPVLSPWNANRDSKHGTLGLGILSDMQMGERLNLIVGARVDYIAIESWADPDSTGDGPRTGPAKTTGVSNRETARSYSVSLSYAVTPQIIPYLTNSRQASLQMGNLGDIVPGNVTNPLTDSALDEVGLKVQLLDGKLYSTMSAYRQTREQIDPDTYEAFSTEGEGYELEIRYVPTKRISITGAASWQETVYLEPPTSFTVPPEFFGLSGIAAYWRTLRVSGLPADGRLPRTRRATRHDGRPVWDLHGPHGAHGDARLRQDRRDVLGVGEDLLAPGGHRRVRLGVLHRRLMGGRPTDQQPHGRALLPGDQSRQHRRTPSRCRNRRGRTS